jgi:hypothetical protein
MTGTPYPIEPVASASHWFPGAPGRPRVYTNALVPVIARPTISVLISRVPS